MFCLTPESHPSTILPLNVIFFSKTHWAGALTLERPFLTAQLPRTSLRGLLNIFPESPTLSLALVMPSSINELIGEKPIKSLLEKCRFNQHYSSVTNRQLRMRGRYFGNRNGGRLAFKRRVLILSSCVIGLPCSFAVLSS